MAVVVALVAAMVATAAVSGCGPLGVGGGDGGGEWVSLEAPDPWVLGADCALRLCPRPWARVFAGGKPSRRGSLAPYLPTRQHSTIPKSANLSARSFHTLPE